VSFEDDISALIDRPCRRSECERIVPESSASDDFCSENCEASWRAENNGCTVVDCGDWGIDVHVPEGHPAAPTYQSPQEAAFGPDGPPRSFMELIRRQLSQLWDRMFLGDLDRFAQNVTGILHATRPAEERRPNPAVGLMQIMHAGRTELPLPPAGVEPGDILRNPAVPPTVAELQQMREQIARIFGVPLPLIEAPPSPPRRYALPELQTLNELGADPVNFTAPPALPFSFFRAPGMPLDRAYHVVPPREGEERRAELVHVAFDPATPDARPLFYTVHTRYDHQHDRVVAELVVRVPRPGWANVEFDGIGYLRSVRSRAEEFRQLVHGEWIEEPEDMPVGPSRYDRLEGLSADVILEQARELGFQGVDPEPEIPPYRDQSET
jgi:hypothetical protein